MEVNAKRAFELLNKLSFERVSCTAEETRTAEALLAEIDSFTWARSDIQRVPQKEESDSDNSYI